MIISQGFGTQGMNVIRDTETSALNQEATSGPLARHRDAGHERESRDRNPGPGTESTAYGHVSNHEDNPGSELRTGESISKHRGTSPKDE